MVDKEHSVANNLVRYHSNVYNTKRVFFSHWRACRQVQTKFEVSDQDARVFLALKQNQLEKVQELCTWQ